MGEGSCAQTGCTRTPQNAKRIIWDPPTSQPQKNSTRSSRAKKGGKTTAHIPWFYKLFPTAKIKIPWANLAKHVNKFYVIAQTHVVSSIRCIFRNFLQTLSVLVGLLFSFPAPHKHPGDLKKKKKAIFRLACAERTKTVSPRVWDVKSSKTICWWLLEQKRLQW